MHRHTPALSVNDPRRAVVREIAYHRRSDQQAPQARITQHIYSTRNRASHSRDPRLFALHEYDGAAPANQTTITTLSGLPMLSISVDAGWRLSLYGAAGQRLEDWDQKRNYLRMTYDSSLRPARGFESAMGEEQQTACFAYGDGLEESVRHNRCGQLIRHDDCAGTQYFTEFGVLGAPLHQTRRFLAHLQVPDWPENETERDKLLEPQGALTQMSFNSVGEWVRHVDVLGNEQKQRQTVAGELFKTRIRLANTDDEITLAGDIQYNAFGQIVQQKAGNGVVTRAVFAPEDGRLATLQAQLASQPPLQSLTYAYDPVGNPIRMTDATQSIRYSRNQSVAAINTWQYDTLGQLIEARGRQRCNAPGGPHLPAFVSPPDPGQLENYLQTFDYDAGGNLEVLHHHADSANRTERTAVATLSNRSLPWSDGIESPGDSEIDAAYDACGNLNVLQRGQTLHWDARNRLRQVDQVVRENEPADSEIYIYDGDDQRVRKIRTADTGTLIRIHETRYLPGVEIRTTPDETLHVISVQSGRCTVRILHWERGSPPDGARHQLRYCLADHQESSTLELDQDARIISQESYYPYGGTAWWAGRDRVEASYKTVRYSGQERDATGLYYYGFRYYMPWRQRWLSADPAGAIDGLNLYRMVGGNPVRFVDVHGLAGNDLSLMEQGGQAAQRTSTVQWVGARVADVVRGGVASATGELASVGVSTLLETTAGSTLRGANAAMSAVAHGYAGGGLAENYIRNHRLRSRFATVPIRFTGYVLGAGMGAASGYLSPDPLGSLARTTSRAFEAGMSSFTSGVGPSIQNNTPSGGWSVVFEGGVNLATGVLEGAYLPQVSGLNPVLQGFITGSIKQIAGAAIRRLGNVDTSYIPSSELSFPGWEELDAGLKQFGHNVLMDITYSNSMDWVVVSLEGAGHESFTQTHPVADSILHTVNPIAELDPLIGQRVQNGYRQRAVDNMVGTRKFLATV
ncbi:RHS repeat-associated core domain-containing protein [Pseudomonas sp. GM48]|uniref:RHS repeat-associated core domain-containing protein n=1 Tax=Pseudomonas sp. GM48 TaxID=1144330 RepID=UPI00027030CD|nr:RHS repeat-associated core domain-containing protein [Pseudomonas sp. GM48]EJM60477.1 RHS repeat-associated core domain protein containing protein [Pseudomonas sp. GM48]